MALRSGATIFDYCERGGSPAFWAEPLNAVTNAGFVMAALAGIVMVASRPSSERSLWHYFFILNFIAIGIGSFMFHTVPNVQTVQADTGPIGIFMLSYLTFAMRRLAGVSWFLTLAGIAAFIGLMVLAFNVQCWDGRFGFLLDNVPAGAQARCLNGSLGYAPALIAMWLMAGLLSFKRHPSARLIFAAGCVFIVSMAFRSLDVRLCGELFIAGHRAGTHFIWHLLNSVTLFLLLAAAIKYGNLAEQVLPPRPKARPASYAVS
jgi:hypothetical protein